MKEVRLEGLKALQTPAICKFCDTVVEDDIVVGKGEVTICSRCVYLANVKRKTFPKESIYCFKCDSYRGAFKVEYGPTPMTPRSVVTFAFLELDCKGRPVYGVVKASAAWIASTATPMRCSCMTCENKVPVWMLVQNTYMRAYNVDESYNKTS